MGSKDNRYKSRHGGKYEKYFENITGYNKLKIKDKPRFINEHGREQIIDFDFIITIKGITYFIDVTTTYRSDRAKQKAYNGEMLKNLGIKNYRCYMIVNSMDGNKHQSLQGLDGVFLGRSFIQRLKNEIEYYNFLN